MKMMRLILMTLCILGSISLTACHDKKSQTEDDHFQQIIANGDRNTTGVLNNHPIKDPFGPVNKN